ncbi:hypothetical protein AVEN_178354-1 [Araneus ventricosus]|uniref:Tc1-like transposase DDE domain-containing protein n=1 Tax=Araneus ventricosus TaxID=182803 RepID=A0A4Y2BCK2_ARAVE|nr:hypothetical protein AVEN_178354-1 [Araneus ventricosus]
MVEHLHRPFKQALTCHQADWLDALPLVLLGIRTFLREDLNASAAELVYASSLRLPGQLFEEKRIDQCPDYVARLQGLFRAVSPTFPLRHGPQRIYIPKDLEPCSHVFLRRPPFKKTLQTPYEGPFKRADRNFPKTRNEYHRNCTTVGFSQSAFVSIHAKWINDGDTSSRRQIFQQDNAPCHKARIVLEWFEEHTDEFHLMSWPHNSPDLNPMEHVWDVMERQLRAQTQLCPNISTLRDRCLDIGYNLSPVMYQKLVASMPRRVAAVLKIKGGATRC